MRGSGFALGDNAVYFGSNDDNAYAVDRADGSEIWSFSTGADVESGFALGDNAVYFGSDDGNAYAVQNSDQIVYEAVRVSDGDDWLMGAR